MGFRIWDSGFEVWDSAKPKSESTHLPPPNSPTNLKHFYTILKAETLPTVYPQTAQSKQLFHHYPGNVSTKATGVLAGGKGGQTTNKQSTNPINEYIALDVMEHA